MKEGRERDGVRSREKGEENLCPKNLERERIRESEIFWANTK
jgi:hypothetical protein